MHAATETTPTPPSASDREGWTTAIHNGDHVHYRLEAIVAAIQDLPREREDRVVNALADHLSQTLRSVLRRAVSFQLPNKGRDIIERTHGHILEAIVCPNSADGQALRIAFVPRVMFRMRTAIADALRQPLTGAELNDTLRDQCTDEQDRNYVDESMDVEQLLRRFPHQQKRRAFELYMDGIPFTSSCSPSIAESFGISENTARTWIDQVRRYLLTLPEVHAIRLSRMKH